jgi:hypothetical protein
VGITNSPLGFYFYCYSCFLVPVLFCLFVWGGGATVGAVQLVLLVVCVVAAFWTNQGSATLVAYMDFGAMRPCHPLPPGAPAYTRL